MKTILTTFNSKYIHSSLALASLSAYAKQCGFAVQTFEFSLQTPVLSALSEIFAARPDVVGVAVHIWNRQLCFSLARLMKKVLPQTMLVLGGPEVSFALEQTFSELPEADFIVQGEGEESLCALLEKLASGKDGKGVPGVAWQDVDGTIQTESGLQVVDDLSRLPFPYDFSVADLSNRIAYYESTRGCPFSCSYCLSGVSKNIRHKPVAQVLDDLSRFIAAGVKQVKFVDRTYNLDKKHYLPVMRWLAQQETKTNFHFEIKADTLDDETLDFLSTVPKGLFQFEIGIQSVHEKTLRASGRSQDWDKLCHAVKKLKSFGNIHLHLDLIAGLPYETLPDFAVSFNKVYALEPDVLQLGFLKLLKGSLLTKQAQDYGYLFMPEPPYEVLSNNFINYAELRKLKILEDVFEQTHNSGKFVHTLQYIIKKSYNNDSFAFYNHLADWWEAKDFFAQGHNARTIARNLSMFCHERMSNKECMDILDCLKHDIILFHERSFRPDWLSWQTTGAGTLSEKFWRNNKIVEKYLPEYKFKSWREINSNYHIEVFEHYFMERQSKGTLAILFDFDKKALSELKEKDFFA